MIKENKNARIVILIFILLLVPGILIAYEPGSFNLINPTGLEKGKMELIFQHRFKGEVGEDPINTFFGMDYAGANIGLGFRYVILPKLELNAKRIWNGKEYILDIGYSYAIPQTPISARMDMGFFSYEEFALEEGEFKKIRTNGGFGVISLISEPFYRVTPVLNIGYDSDNKKIGVGVGLAVKILENMGILRQLKVLVEYYPLSKEDEYKNSLALGIRAETFKHHFDLILSNNSRIGIKNLMSGSQEEDGLKFGFNIKRLL